MPANNYLNHHHRGRHHHHHHHTTSFQSYINILKGYIGCGCLSLPWAFSILGMTLGVVSTVLISIVTSYNCIMLIEIKRNVCDRRRTTYSDLGEITYGRKFRSFITASIATYQLGICSVFLSFIGDNISTVLESNLDITLDHRLVTTFALPLVMILTCVPNLKALSPVIILAMLFLLGTFSCLGVVIGLNWEDRNDDGRESAVGVDWSKAIMAICAIMYSFEGICLVVPIESVMIDRTQFHTTYAIAMCTIVLIYVSVATISVVAFGGGIDDGSITAYLLDNKDDYEGDGWITTANIFASASILLSYPLQMYPNVVLAAQARVMRWRRRRLARGRGGGGEGVVEEYESVSYDSDNDYDDVDDDRSNLTPLIDESDIPMNDSDEDDGNDLFVSNQMLAAKSDYEGDAPWVRMSLVLVTYVVAVVIPDVTDIISLVGALAGSCVAMIIPPLMELRYVSEKMGCRAVKNYLLVALGVVFGVSGTVFSIIDIIDNYS